MEHAGPSTPRPRPRWLRWVLIGGAGLIGVAMLFVVGLVIGIGYSVYEWSQANQCESVNDSVIPEGSCAPPFTAEDFASGNAIIDLGGLDEGSPGLYPYLTYSVTNQTNERRSWDWTKLTLKAPSGAIETCWGDDSSLRYSSPPGETREAYGGCHVAEGAGVYTLLYDGQPVADAEAAP